MKKLKVLIACEFSGIVRDAFARLGHSAMSCDLLPTDNPKGWHYTGDVKEVLGWGWDLMIAHPPCTYLSVSGARWMYNPDGSINQERYQNQQEALQFVQMLMDADIPRIAIENPVSVISTAIRKPDQYVQPYWFGHGETKKTGLWLKNLPLLVPTNLVEGREGKVWRMGPSEERWKLRSKTSKGLAEAMADQWGNLD